MVLVGLAVELGVVLQLGVVVLDDGVLVVRTGVVAVGDVVWAEVPAGAEAVVVTVLEYVGVVVVVAAGAAAGLVAATVPWSVKPEPPVGLASTGGVAGGAVDVVSAAPPGRVAPAVVEMVPSVGPPTRGVRSWCLSLVTTALVIVDAARLAGAVAGVTGVTGATGAAAAGA